MTDPIVKTDKLSKTYTMEGEEITALREVSFSVAPGEYIAIMGPSGSGKSTLMNLLGCLDTPTSGSYYLRGADVSTLGDDELAAVRNRDIGFIFQTFNLLPRMTALENVELPLVYSGMAKAERRALAEQAMVKVSLQDRMLHRPNEMSGGQRQRVAVARALVNTPALLLADEPTGNLDSRTGDEIMALFAELNKQGNTIIVVTHEPDIAAHAPRTVRIKDGLVQADGPSADVIKLHLTDRP